MTTERAHIHAHSHTIKVEEPLAQSFCALQFSMAKLAMIFSTVIFLPLLTTSGVLASTVQCSAFDQLQKSIDLLQAEADKLKLSCCTSTCNQGMVVCFYSFHKFAWRSVCIWIDRNHLLFGELGVFRSTFPISLGTCCGLRKL